MRFAFLSKGLSASTSIQFSDARLISAPTASSDTVLPSTANIRTSIGEASSTNASGAASGISHA